MWKVESWPKILITVQINNGRNVIISNISSQANALSLIGMEI